MAAKGLTDRQRRFCDEYLIDLNATRAYMAAYPSVKKESSAASCATKLLRNAKIQKFLEERKREQQKRVQIDQDKVLEAIQSIAFDMHEKSKDRLRALEMLCRHLGILDQKDDLDRREQEARIAKLQRDTEAQDEQQEIKVSIMGMSPDELSEVIG